MYYIQPALSRQAEAQGYGDVEVREGEAGGEGGEDGALHHLVDALVEVGITGAFGEAEAENAAGRVDAEMDDRVALLGGIAGGVGVTLVGFEPAAEQRPVLRGEFRVWRGRGRGGRSLGSGRGQGRGRRRQVGHPRVGFRFGAAYDGTSRRL